MDKSDYFTAMLLNLPGLLLTLGAIIVGLAGFWHFINWRTKFDDDHELFDKNNYAYLLQRAGLLGAFLIGCVPVIVRERTGGTWFEIGVMFAQIAWVFVALLAVRVVVDKLLLPKIDNLQALLDGNIALGAVEAGFYIGFGAILNGSLTGTSPSGFETAASTVVFGLLGLAVMIGMFFVHEYIVRRFSKLHLRENIQNGDMAASLEVAGILAALGIVVREGVAGDFVSWPDSLFAFAMTALFAIVILYVLRFAIDKVIFRKHTIRQIVTEGRVVAAAMLAALFIIGAIPVGMAVRTLL